MVRLLLRIFLVVILLWGAFIVHWLSNVGELSLTVLVWSVVQWIPMAKLALPIQHRLWTVWGQQKGQEAMVLEVPTIQVRDNNIDLEGELVRRFGADWRLRPLLLKGLWNDTELSSSNRRLSLQGLLKEDLEIPYFTDARASTTAALTPDSRGPISGIVSNITQGHPHKIASQWFLQTYPELIEEVAPVNLLSNLFGNFFTAEKLRGSMFLPAFTTVPLFVAKPQKVSNETCGDKPPLTNLHCEPIGNVAVQLNGSKRWVLISPEHTFRVQPAAAPDGRAFFYSAATDYSHVPRYHVVTTAGDALWVPTWTWHRVDYVGDDDDNQIAIGASLFHFRPISFLRNNPLLAGLLVPAILKELAGISTQ